jgi:hypothetical protein
MPPSVPPASRIGPDGSSISRRSQSCAAAQSRFTVRADTFSAAAVSSTVSPPKKRHSTTRPRRGWISSSRDSAACSASNRTSFSSSEVVTSHATAPARSRSITSAAPPRFAARLSRA